MRLVRSMILLVGCTLVGVAACEIGTEPAFLFICVVDNDTLLLPGDTSGIKCADWADSLRFPADSL